MSGLTSKAVSALKMPQRYDHKFCKASGSREMDPAAEGEWVRYEEVVTALQYVSGYLDAHAALLKSEGAHPKIVESVRFLIADIEAL